MRDNKVLDKRMNMEPMLYKSYAFSFHSAHLRASTNSFLSLIDAMRDAQRKYRTNCLEN